MAGNVVPYEPIKNNKLLYLLVTYDSSKLADSAHLEPTEPIPNGKYPTIGRLSIHPYQCTICTDRIPYAPTLHGPNSVNATDCAGCIRQQPGTLGRKVGMVRGNPFRASPPQIFLFSAFQLTISGAATR